MAYTTKTILSESDVATRTTLGVVKIGRGIDITPDGVISATTKIIVSAGLTRDGDLILVYNDGTEINAGHVVGPAGPVGPQGDSADISEPAFGTILVSEDYECTNDDCYIGVNSSGPITITLPVHPGDGFQIALKIEMPELAEDQYVTIETNDGSTIDGAVSYTMTEPWQSVHLLNRGGHWFIL